MSGANLPIQKKIARLPCTTQLIAITKRWYRSHWALSTQITLQASQKSVFWWLEDGPHALWTIRSQLISAGLQRSFSVSATLPHEVHEYFIAESLPLQT